MLLLLLVAFCHTLTFLSITLHLSNNDRSTASIPYLHGDPVTATVSYQSFVISTIGWKRLQQYLQITSIIETSVVDEGINTPTNTAELPSNVITNGNSNVNENSNFPSDEANHEQSTSRVGPPVPMVEIGTTATHNGAGVLQKSQNTTLPSGEEMNCKNTLQSFDGIERYPMALYHPSSNELLPDISGVSLPSDLQTLPHTIIGTPIITSTTAAAAAAINTTTNLAHNAHVMGTDTIPIHADAVVAVSTVPEAEAYVIHNSNTPHMTSKNRLYYITIGTGIVCLLIIGMIIGLTIPLVTLSPDNNDVMFEPPQSYISEYIYQYITNITLSNHSFLSMDDRRNITTKTTTTAEEASLQWVIANSIYDPDWFSFFERHGKDHHERAPSNAMADLRQHIELTQKYVL
jgi:hypothetical protein